MGIKKSFASQRPPVVKLKDSPKEPEWLWQPIPRKNGGLMPEEAHIARVNDFLARIKVKLPQHFSSSWISPIIATSEGIRQLIAQRYKGAPFAASPRITNQSLVAFYPRPARFPVALPEMLGYK